MQKMLNETHYSVKMSMKQQENNENMLEFMRKFLPTPALEIGLGSNCD